MTTKKIVLITGGALALITAIVLIPKTNWYKTKFAKTTPPTVETKKETLAAVKSKNPAPEERTA